MNDYDDGGYDPYENNGDDYADDLAGDDYALIDFEDEDDFDIAAYAEYCEMRGERVA